MPEQDGVASFAACLARSTNGKTTHLLRHADGPIPPVNEQSQNRRIQTRCTAHELRVERAFASCTRQKSLAVKSFVAYSAAAPLRCNLVPWNFIGMEVVFSAGILLGPMQERPARGVTHAEESSRRDAGATKKAPQGKPGRPPTNAIQIYEI